MAPPEQQRQAQAAFERQVGRAKALGDPLRFRIMAILMEREASPAELAEELGESLRKVCYHIEYLRGALPHSPEPFIELVSTDQRRGGTIHIYRSIERRQRIDMAAAAEQPRADREEASAIAIDKIVGDLRAAQRDGTVDSHAQRTLMRVIERVDDQAVHELAALAEAHVTTTEEIVVASQLRLAKSGETPIRIAAATTVVPLSSDP